MRTETWRGGRNGQQDNRARPEEEVVKRNYRKHGYDFFSLFCCSVSDFSILYQIVTVLRVLGSKFSLISMKNNVRRWARVGKNGEVRLWKKGALGMRKETGAA